MVAQSSQREGAYLGEACASAIDSALGGSAESGQRQAGLRERLYVEASLRPRCDLAPPADIVDLIPALAAIRLRQPRPSCADVPAPHSSVAAIVIAGVSALLPGAAA